MNEHENGGPAFARTYAEVERDRMQMGMKPAKTPFGHDGMTLRDYFAAKAMPVAARRLDHNYTAEMDDKWRWDDDDWQALAEHSYAIADAMLAERSKS